MDRNRHHRLAPVRAQHDRLRVLIVDADPIYADAVRQLLEREGHTVLGIAPDAASVAALMRVLPAELALVNTRLRDGLSGPEIGRALVRAGVSVLFLTNVPNEVPVDGGGAVAILSKPAGDVRLLRAVAAVIAARLPTEAGRPTIIRKDASQTRRRVVPTINKSSVSRGRRVELVRHVVRHQRRHTALGTGASEIPEGDSPLVSAEAVFEPNPTEFGEH